MAPSSPTDQSSGTSVSGASSTAVAAQQGSSNGDRAHQRPSSNPGALEQELVAFRQQWLEERNRNNMNTATAVSTSDRRQWTSDSARNDDDDAMTVTQRRQDDRQASTSNQLLEHHLQGLNISKPDTAAATGKPTPPRTRQNQPLPSSSSSATTATLTNNSHKSALEVYGMAVNFEREGRLNDALTHYRRAFKMDPDVDRSFHRASIAPKNSSTAQPQNNAKLGGADGTAPAAAATGEFKFERTIQVTPDYAPEREHRSVEAVERGLGKGKATADTTHPSSTGYLFDSLMRSIARHPFERKKRDIRQRDEVDHGQVSRAATTSPSSTVIESRATTSVQEALDNMAFIPDDPDKPLYLNMLPREVLVHILRIIALTSIVPPPRMRTVAHDEQQQQQQQQQQQRQQQSTSSSAQPGPTQRTKRGAPKRKTLRELTREVESDLELEPHDRRAWQIDVEALERFARTCRFARILTLDVGIWKAICQRVYLPPHQIKQSQSIEDIVSLHGHDWRRCLIEHARVRFDGCYISVVTYLRRGENTSWFAPSHLITFYRYLRFYDNGLVISLLTVDTPDTIVRHLNPALRMKGLTFGRWRLNDDNVVEMWGLEDPCVEESRRKYSFRMTCRLKSTARGRMNKLEMMSMATEHRTTLELCDVPIKPTKPFHFSVVRSYAGELRYSTDDEYGLTFVK
ncbi:hypothetical protein ACM66B_003513 [Microbotryomycetes sp. NB124-2]